MIFLTVGSEFHFDRLVAAVDRLIAERYIGEEVIAQIAAGRYIPQHMNWVSTMPRGVYNAHIERSNGVISHAGMGTIIQCLQMRKPLLVMPRLKRHREHVNDHQFGTAQKFEQRGSILVAYDIADLPSKIQQLKSFRPYGVQSESRHCLVARINNFLKDLEDHT
jgi:UDP-N-acetylglucosamine transferase subunit ALG13